MPEETKVIYTPLSEHLMMVWIYTWYPDKDKYWISDVALEYRGQSASDLLSMLDINLLYEAASTAAFEIELINRQAG